VALGYWGKKRYDDAERALHVATSIEPRFPQALLALAYLPYARRPDLWEEVVRGKVPDGLKAALVDAARLGRRSFLIDPLVDLPIIGAVAPPRRVPPAPGALERAQVDYL